MSAPSWLEVPGVRLGQGKHPALGSQDLERRHGDALEPVGGSAVRRVGVAERRGVAQSPTRPVGQVADVESSRGGGLEDVERCGEYDARGGADRGVLRLDQLDRLGRPRQQLAVQRQPVGVERREQRSNGRPQPVDERSGVGEERPAGAGVERAGAAVGRCRTVCSAVARVARDHGDRPGAHVLLLADHVGHAPPGVLLERLLGVLEEPLALSTSTRATWWEAGRSASAGRPRSGS